MTDGEIVQQAYDSFAKGDVRAVLAALDDKIEWTESAGFAYAGTYVGPQSVLNDVFMRLGTEWEGFASRPEQIVDGGDGTVVSIGWYSGTFKATGKPLNARFAHVWEIRDGKVTRFEQIVDSAKANEPMT